MILETVTKKLLRKTRTPAVNAAGFFYSMTGMPSVCGESPQGA